MAAIGWTRKDGTGVDWNCGGSLITSKAVLTAAHCFYFEKVKPDLVRLGDHNLYSTLDDKFAQEFKIEFTIRHPNYKLAFHYDDIGLLILNGEIAEHGIVTPACLWREDSTEFEEFEVAGWGLTETDQKSEELLKTKLKACSNSECSEYYEPTRRMVNGIRQSQICASELISDTCQGDSGGPLQVKLPSKNNWVPFLVGITSMGKSCGSQLPSVYTRISSYIDWIEQSLNHTIVTDPNECMEHYKNYEMPSISHDRTSQHFIQIGWRDADNDKEPNAGTDGPSRVTRIRSLFLEESKVNHISQINASWECGGVLISEDYVLTSAQCLLKRDRSPDLIRTSDGQDISTSNIIFHKNFDPNSYYHDLALIKLENDVILSYHGTRPACLWAGADIGFDIKQQQTNSSPSSMPFVMVDQQEAVQTPEVTIPLTNNTVCNDAFIETNNLINGVDAHYQICMMNPVYIDPGVCDKSRGGGVKQQMPFNGYVVDYVVAINSFGGKCDFNTPMVATKVQPYLDWINSVVFAVVHNKLAFSSRVDSVEKILQADTTQRHFEESQNDIFFGDQAVGDLCTHGRTKIKGQCVEMSDCNGGQIETAQNKQLQMCAVSPTVLVCCPDSLIGIAAKKDPTNGPGTIIGCSQKYAHLRDKTFSNLTLEDTQAPSENVEFAHIGEFYMVHNPTDSCYTTLISDRHVITSVKCAANHQWKEIRFGVDQDSQYFKIMKVSVHPNYNDTANLNDLVVMELNTTVRFSQSVQPACIWHDDELIPYELQQLVLFDTLQIYAQHYAYNADCQRIYDRYRPAHQIQLSDTVLCVQDNVCPKLGMAIQKLIIVDNMYVPFVFGVYFQERNCVLTDDRLPFLYTRLAHYVDWLQSVVDSEE